MKQLTRSDVVWLLFWLAVEIAACAYFSHGRQYWSDEIFGWMVARDPSLHHMLFAWQSGADGGGIFFYLAARAWMFVFGPSALALRLFTAFGMWIALALTWITARLWYRFEIVAVSVPFCWFTAHSLLRQLMIGRFYGMLLASTAAVVCCYGLAARSRTVSVRLTIAVFATNCLLVGTHPFGLLYSGIILGATMVLDCARRTVRPRLYFAAILGWSILWPSRFALQASAAVGKPHFWTTTPTIDDLQSAFVFWTDELQWLWAILLVVVIAFGIIAVLKKRRLLVCKDAPSWLIGFSLMAVIPILWLLSLHGTSYFVDRYLIPTAIGATLLQCAALQRLIPVDRPRWLTSVLGVAVIAVSAGSVYSFFNDIPLFAEPPHAYTDAMIVLLPRTLPVVVERVDIFAEAVHAAPDIQWRYLLDWPIATSPQSLRGEVSGFHEMENWRKAGYENRIQPSDQFLASQRDFWVITDPAELWWETRILHNPAFQIHQIGQFSRESSTETIWHVHRLP